jgi:hypothetical protein
VVCRNRPPGPLFRARPAGGRLQLTYIGADTLGAQAFLHGFVNAHRPIQDVAAVDCGFCLVLCVVIAGFSLRPRGWGLVAVVAELLMVAINPLVVNISSVFSSALFVPGRGS